MRFVLYDSFVPLWWNQRHDLRISEIEWSCVQLIASCGRALRNVKKFKSKFETKMWCLIHGIYTWRSICLTSSKDKKNKQVVLSPFIIVVPQLKIKIVIKYYIKHCKCQCYCYPKYPIINCKQCFLVTIDICTDRWLFSWRRQLSADTRAVMVV